MPKKDNPHMHYWLGDNQQCHPGEEVIFKLSNPRVFIRYRLEKALFADFDEFYKSIAEVQWIDGEKPSIKTQQEILIEAWNFLAIEEQILEDDLDNDYFDYEDDEN